MSATHQHLTADGCTKAMAHKDDIPYMLFVQHCIDSLRKEVERVFHVRLAALAITRKVDKDELQVVFVAQSLELFLPSIKVAAKAMNEADGLIAIAILFIMYANAVVNSHIL